MTQIEEYKIIEKVQQGDANAFSFLVIKYQDIVFSIALKMLKNREDAEEMAQEAFIKAYRSIGSFQGKSKFSTWLFRITYNACISNLRRKKHPTADIDSLQVDDEEGEDRFDGFREENRIRYLEFALKQLPGDEYLLIVMYYYEDQSVGDICMVTGLSESNVKVKLFRARKKLHSIMCDLTAKEEFAEL